MTNIFILTVSEFKKKIAASFLIEGLQKFEQYTTINPINVEIILILETNYRFIQATINVNLDLSLIVYFLVQ